MCKCITKRLSSPAPALAWKPKRGVGGTERHAAPRGLKRFFFPPGRVGPVSLRVAVFFWDHRRFCFVSLEVRKAARFMLALS